MNYWRDMFEELICSIGVATYGKERWFTDDDGNTWYDRYTGRYFETTELIGEVTKAINEEIENETD